MLNPDIKVALPERNPQWPQSAKHNLKSTYEKDTTTKTRKKKTPSKVENRTMERKTKQNKS